MSALPIHVILSHEHTDFDALASMLGAWLLFPNALPVLPRKLNRNVGNFLTLYKNQLPFVTDKDVPRGHVERAILVDTRAANFVRGMDGDTEIVIIDHHVSEGEAASAASLGGGWIGAVGANATLLIEKLIERDVELTPVQATLMALGIHEDTGSLTYPSTTHRDARCLAWLLEPMRGVNMEVLAQFLNHPLSRTQRALFELLIDASEFLEIAGHSVVVAAVRAPDFKEEISALVSRLRDFHESGAIFVIIDLGEVVQLVARSTTDEIDVGAVARALGGGGHRRAAAAPIRAMSVEEVRARVLELVQVHSRAATLVRHIMSAGRPQSLTPEMTIGEASTLMRRYGHEGFPVIAQTEDGEELLGVLTRREADRAMGHGLEGQPVSKFMRAGKVTIGPDDSVTQLRRLMIESDWGQIPVTDESGKIIGIVTRTDLIKLWDDALLPGKLAGEYADRLRHNLAPAQYGLLKLIGREVDRMNFSVYVVGGFVRDLLLNHGGAAWNALDLDIVIEGDAIAFARRMLALYGGRIVPHKRFNTAKWLLDDPDHPLHRDALLEDLGNPDPAGLPPHLDFITARTEFYTAPTVLPTVEDSSIKLDLHRRDFTINTLALCLNPDRWGELLDFYGGLADLRQGVIRVLHSLSFLDDPTRILRGVRYEQRFGFVIDPRTLELLTDAVELLDRVTPTRIRHELERILQEAEPERALMRLDELGVLRRLHPSLVADEWVREKYARLRRALDDLPPDSPLAGEPVERLYWGVLVFRLSPEADSELALRLGLRGETQRLVRDLAKIREKLGELRRPNLLPSEAVRLLESADVRAVALASIILDGKDRAARVLRRYLTEWRHIEPELNGDNLRELGIKTGPIYGRILDALRAGRLDGTITSRSDELEVVRQMRDA